MRRSHLDWPQSSDWSDRQQKQCKKRRPQQWSHTHIVASEKAKMTVALIRREGPS